MDEPPSPRYHPAPSRNEIAFVQPVLVSLGINRSMILMFDQNWYPS